MVIPQFIRSISAKPGLCMAALLLVIPFIGLFMPAVIQGFYAEWFAGLIGVMLALSVIKKEAWQSIHLPQTSLIFLGLLAVVVVQWMLGMLHSSQYAFMISGYLIWAFMLSMLGAKLKRQYGWSSMAEYLAVAAAGGGLIVTLLFALQHFSILPNTAIQSAHLVAYLSMALVSVIYLTAKQRFKTWLGMAFVLVFLTAIASLAPRLGWFLVTVIALLFVLQQVLAIQQQNGSRQRRSLVRLGLLLIPIYWVLTIFTPASLQAPLSKDMLSYALPAAQSLQAYWDIWKTSWQIYTTSPWLGVGMGNVAWHSYLSVQAPVMQGQVGVFSHAHQQWLQVLLELGAGGLLLAVVGLAGWLIAFKWRHSTLESWWLIGMVGVMLAHGMFEPQLGFAYFLGVFALLLGMGDEKTTELKLPVIGKFASAAYVACLSVLLVSTLFGYQKLDFAVPLAQKENLSVSEEATLHRHLGWVHNSTLLAPYAQLLYAKGLRVNSVEVDAKLWLSDSAMRFRPASTMAYQHVLLLKLHGDHDSAVHFLKQALNAYPMKITQQLQLFPIRHYQDYLDVLSDARPIKRKT